jgi:hypothetical protein
MTVSWTRRSTSDQAANRQPVTSRAGWFLFPDPTKLALCNETMLLDMVVKSAVSYESRQPVVRACSSSFESNREPVFAPDNEKASLCTTANRVLEQASVYVHQPQVEDNNEFSVNHLISASQQMKDHLALQQPSCANNAMEFAYSQSSSIGLFVGAEIHQHGITTDILERFMAYAREQALTKSTIVQVSSHVYCSCAGLANIAASQLCSGDQRGADYSFGIVATSSKNLAFIQEAVKTWADGSCVSQATTGQLWMEVELRVPTPINGTSTNNTNSTGASNFTTPARSGARSLLIARADCRTASVQSGDGCWAVADRCGISQTDLEKYNRANLCNTLVKDERVCCNSGTLPSTLPGGNSDGTCKTREVVSGDNCGSLASKCGVSADDFMKVNTKRNLCSSLAEGQRVCCSDGKMPDLKPKPDSNGNCAVYTTKKDDNCAKIAASRDLTVKDLEDFNTKTWGWNGCQLLWPDYKMCVSSGSPPMPANVPVRHQSTRPVGFKLFSCH